MRHLIAAVLALAYGLTAAPPAWSQRTVKLSTVEGFDLADAKAAFQKALGDLSVDVLVVDDDRGATIATSPVYTDRDDVVLRFESGVTLRGKPDAFGPYESLLTFYGSDVTVEGNGATLEMDKYEYDRSSQYRHCINLSGVQRVIIEDLTLRGAPGDGLFMGPGYVDQRPVDPCRDVVVRRVTMVDNNRQGSSLTHVDGVTFEGCGFYNTAGADPQAGLSLEPFGADQLLRDVLVSRCRFAGNAGSGVEYVAVDQTPSSPPISVTLEDCVFENNNLARSGAAIRVSNKTNAPGTFVVRRTSLHDERRAGVIVRQYAPGVAVTLDDVTVEGVNREPYNSGVGALNVWPVNFDDADDAPFGNVEFRDVRVVEPEDRIQVSVPGGGSNPPAVDVRGDICVESAYGLDADLGSSPPPALAVVACSDGPLPSPTSTTVRVRARTAYGGTGAECAVAFMANANYASGNNALAYERFATTGDWEVYTVSAEGDFAADQIRTWFTNNRDDVTPNRDLDIDWIEVDGVRYEAESEDTYSTGTWTSYDGCADGFKWSGRLHCSGYLHFAVRGGNIGAVDRSSDGAAATAAGPSAMRIGGIRAYPNPAASGGVVYLEGAPIADGTRAVVTDVSGRVALDVPLGVHDGRPRAAISLPAEGMPPGIYELTLVGGDEPWTQRLVVQ